MMKRLLLIATIAPILSACITVGPGGVQTRPNAAVTACAGGMATFVAGPILRIARDATQAVMGTVVDGAQKTGGVVVDGHHREEASSTRGPGRNRDCLESEQEVIIGW